MIDRLIPVLKEAGEILIKYQDSSFNVKYKGKNDPVTDADFAVDDLLKKKMSELFPDDQLVTEETPSNVDFSKRVWFIDPLDGTRSFIKKHDGFSILLGLCDNGVPIFGVVYIPRRDQIFYAKKGKGAFLIEKGVKKKIHVSDSKDPLKMYLTTFDEKEQSLFSESEVNLNCKTESAGSRFMKVATGETDVYLELSGKSHKWDACGPHTIIEEAGGIMSDRNGDPLDYKNKDTRWIKNAIATNSHVHKMIVEKLK